jgi:hypothetical protein
MPGELRLTNGIIRSVTVPTPDVYLGALKHHADDLDEQWAKIESQKLATKFCEAYYDVNGQPVAIDSTLPVNNTVIKFSAGMVKRRTPGTPQQSLWPPG